MDNGSLRYGANPSLPHSLDAKFSATPTQLNVESAVLKLGSSSLSVNAALTNYSTPVVDGGYLLRINAQDVSAMAQPVVPKGEVTLEGSIHYSCAEGQSPLRCVTSQGEISSDELAASSAQGRFDVRALQGHYKLENASLQADDIAFETLGGKISTVLTLEHLDSTASVHVRSTAKGISLRAAQQRLRQAEGKQVSLSGRVDGTVEASWSGSVSKIMAHADLTVASNAASQSSSNILPVNGGLHASYDGTRSVITLRDSSLRIPAASLTAQGEISKHSNLQVQARADDLHQLVELLSALGNKQASSLELAGSASLKANVRGTLRRPEIAAQVNAQNLQVEGSQWHSLQASLQAGPSQLVLRDAVLINAHQGKASFSGSVGLREWAYLASSPISATVSVQKMAIVDLQRLANLHYPLSGDLSADINFRGSQLNPAGSGSAKIERAQAYDEPIQHLAATFKADSNSLSSAFSFNLNAGAASGTLSFTPKTKAYNVRLDAPSIILQKLHTLQAKNLGIAGTLTLSVSGAGTIENPQLEASIAIPQLQMRDKAVSEIKAQLHVADQHAAFALDSQVVQSSIRARANIALTGNYDADASIDTSGIALAPLFAAYSPNPPKGFSGETELHATLKGPLKDYSKLEAHLTIPSLKASYQSLEIGAAAPIHIDYANSVVTLQPAEIRGTDTQLKVQGTIPLTGNASPNLTAQGTVDVRIAQIFSPGLQSSGTISLDLHASGSAKNPAVQGQLRFQEVSLSPADAPVSLQKLNGNLQIVNNSLQLNGLTGEINGGTVSAGGSISYRPDLQFNVTLQSKSIRLRYPDGVRALLDGDLVLNGTKDASTVTGRVLIDSLTFTPDFDLSKFSDQFGGASVPSAPGLLDNIKLAIGVQSKTNLAANSSQVSIEGDVNVQVIGTAANPVIVGRTDLTSGELFYRNVRYQLQRGIITFDNPAETEPTLNMSATTTIEQYNLTITLRGPFDKLTTSYTSDPPLATADVISLIANGQTTSEASAASTSTDSILASQVASQVTGGIQHLAGISSLQLDPLLGGNNQNPSARVAIQQRVTRDFLFTFSTDLSQPGTEVVQGGLPAE